jgi:hypothetical protein
MPAGHELRSGSQLGVSERAIIHVAARDLVLHLFSTLPPRKPPPPKSDDGGA